MKSMILLLLTFFVCSSQAFIHQSILWKSTNGTCMKNSDCSSHGTCIDGTCVCDTFYSGSTCKEKWEDDKSWNDAFIAYGIYATILQLICTIYACHDLFVTIRHYDEEGWSKWTLTTYIHMLGAVAGVFRVVNFAIDPHAERGILPSAAEVLLFQIPVLLWLCVLFMILLYWIELQRSTGIKQLVFISKLRPVLVAVVIISFLFLFPLNLWTAITGQPLAYTVYNGFLSVVFLILVVGLSAAGINLQRVMKISFSVGSHKKMDKFLKKLLRYIVILDVLFITLAVTLLVFTIAQAQTNPNLYLTLHWLLRTQEFSVVIATLVFTRKKQASKKPNFQTSSAPSVRKNNSLIVASSTEDGKKEEEQEQAEMDTKV